MSNRETIRERNEAQEIAAVAARQATELDKENEQLLKALRSIYGHILTFYDVNGLKKPGSFVDEKIGEICLILGDALGENWRAEPDVLQASDRHCAAGGAMNETTTVGGPIIALCGCCGEHGPDPERPAGGMTWQLVTCPECGAPCSCEGCIADAEKAER